MVAAAAAASNTNVHRCASLSSHDDAISETQKNAQRMLLLLRKLKFSLELSGEKTLINTN